MRQHSCLKGSRSTDPQSKKSLKLAPETRSRGTNASSTASAATTLVSLRRGSLPSLCLRCLGVRLVSTNTYPVFCRQFGTCGEYHAYIADSDEKVKGSLFTTSKREPTFLFETIRSGAHTLLTQEQSAFIQRKVLELRKEIGNRPPKPDTTDNDLPF